MEKQDCTVCPICLFYLKDNIAFKDHLQTHSKEKVIEILLNTQVDPLIGTNTDITKIAESRSDYYEILGTLTTLPKSFVGSNNQSIAFTNHSIQNVKNELYPITNVCNSTSNTTAITYQILRTDVGNLMLIPLYNMGPPAVVDSSAFTSVVDSCLVLENSSGMNSINSKVKGTEYINVDVPTTTSSSSSSSSSSNAEYCSELSEVKQNNSLKSTAVSCYLPSEHNECSDDETKSSIIENCYDQKDETSENCTRNNLSPLSNMSCKTIESTNRNYDVASSTCYVDLVPPQTDLNEEIPHALLPMDLEFLDINENHDKFFQHNDASPEDRLQEFKTEQCDILPDNEGTSVEPISCKIENLVGNMNHQSPITEIKGSQDGVKISKNMKKKNEDSLLRKILRQRIVREYHCFYCDKKNFKSWKLRQAHITEDHAQEESLAIEPLFGKKLKLKRENIENEEGCSTKLEDCIVNCRLCNDLFSNTISFIDHLRMVHNVKKRSNICPTCFSRFPNFKEFQNHTKNVHPFECMTCGKKFPSRPGYMLHQKRHMKVRPYSCGICAKSFVTKQKLAEHVNIHNGCNPIKCELCDSRFKRYSNYQQHKRFTHMKYKKKLKDFICHCGEVFHSMLKLKWHREIHDEKLKQCSYCVERFVHEASLTRHIRKWHKASHLSDLTNQKKVKNVPCPVCDVLYLQTSLDNHMKIHKNVKAFSCSECIKSFRTKWNLQLHRWIHQTSSDKPFKCKICVKAYIHKTDYEAHMRSHTNSRPYSCNVCGRHFIRKSNCARHLREHVHPRAHKCNVCGKTFSRSYYLTEHKKVHTGEKPHTCQFCGKASATKSNHNKHMKIHIGGTETANAED